MTDFWNSWWWFALLIAPFAIIIVGQAITIYMVVRDLERVRDMFPNSRFIRNQFGMWSGSGFLAKYMQLNAICGAICLERYYAKRGELDPTEMSRIPTDVRARAWLSTIILIVGISWLLLVVMAHKHLKS